MRWRLNDLGTIASHSAVSCPHCYRDTGGSWPVREGERWTQACEQCPGELMIYDLHAVGESLGSRDRAADDGTV